MINVQNFQLDVSVPAIKRLRLVNGDTANQFVITVTNNKKPVTLDTSLHKVIAVFKRADGQVYTQDANTGVSFTTSGVVTVDVRPASFRTGTNTICLQIYKRENTSATVYPLLLTTQEQQFNARSAAIPEAGAPNSPSQLPMLEQIIHDAGEATTAANNAATAANNAASSATSAASSANTAASNANNAADAANLAAGTLNALLENIDEEPTQFSDNLVTSGGVFQFVSDSVQYATDEVRDQIPLGASVKPLMDGTAAIGNSYKYARQDHVHPSDTSKQDVLTFDNAPTTGSNNPVKSGGVKAAIDAVGTRVTALEGDGPIVLHVASVTESDGRHYITFEEGETDIIYANAFTRDMEFEMPVQNTPQTLTNASLRMRKISAKTDTNNATLVEFGACSFGSAPNIQYAVAGVYFTGDTFYAATYDEGEVTVS